MNSNSAAMGLESKRKPFLSQWKRALIYLPVLCFSLVLMSPMLAIVGAWYDPQWDIWQHLLDTQLSALIGNSVLLLAGVGMGVTLLGVSFAWMITMLDFPGRRVFEWMLILPLAMPAYVLGFVYLGLFDFSGAVPTWFRETWDIRLPSIRSPFGVIWVMTLVLYPYVYMLTRSAFLGQGRQMFQAARTMGLGPWGAFWQVSLPMARPGIVAGVSLALMETLADFGTVSIFNFDTFTTAIYKSWYGFFNLAAAAQLASLLLLIVVLALMTEMWSRGKAQYSQTQSQVGEHRRIKLYGFKAWGVSIFFLLFMLVVFAVPLSVLVEWAWQQAVVDLNQRFFDLLMNTLWLGVIACVVTVVIALSLAVMKRFRSHWVVNQSVMLSTLGYALPGSVLAIGVMLIFASLDQMFIQWLQNVFGYTGGPIFLGSVAALIFAYVVRFLAAAYGSVSASLQQVQPSIDQAAQSLGANRLRIVRTLYLSLLRPGLFTGMLIVLVDVMKEMPATLLLRPFGWDTLAVRIFEMTSEGEWERAALPALALVIAGLIPVFLLLKKSRFTQSSQ